jgi:hypothetical protein
LLIGCCLLSAWMFIRSLTSPNVHHGRSQGACQGGLRGATASGATPSRAGAVSSGGKPLTAAPAAYAAYCRSLQCKGQTIEIDLLGCQLRVRSLRELMAAGKYTRARTGDTRPHSTKATRSLAHRRCRATVPAVALRAPPAGALCPAARGAQCPPRTFRPGEVRSHRERSICSGNLATCHSVGGYRTCRSNCPARPGPALRAARRTFSG